MFHPFKPPANISRAIDNLRSCPAEYWEKKGEETAMNLFRWVSDTTPAYQDFLSKHKINPRKIRTIKDFKNLPFTSKNDYLRPANYIDLFPNRDLVSATTISATSGSTGEPFYFPRKGIHDDMYQYKAEVFLKEQFGVDKKSTLAVLGFALGIWIGGIFTYKVLERISSERRYPLTIVPVGTDKEKFLKVVNKFGHFYDQILLMGYPPFIKDVLEDSGEYGIHWRDYEVKILTATEGYSEKFREYIAQIAGVGNMMRDVVNIYGTVELGTMAHETAFSNLIRHLATKNKKLFQVIFPEAIITPTLCQYYPHLTYFEEVKVRGRSEVVGTGYGAHTPLIRYRFMDLGGVVPFKEMMEKLEGFGIDVKEEVKHYGISPRLIYKLPFVYVYARSDLGVVFRGANVYPEEIRHALDDHDLAKCITGRFSMIRKEDKTLKQILEINVELGKEIEASRELERLVVEKVVSYLCESNSEYNYLYGMEKEKVYPTVVLWPHHHPLYFARAGKQPWVGK